MPSSDGNPISAAPTQKEAGCEVIPIPGNEISQKGFCGGPTCLTGHWVRVYLTWFKFFNSILNVYRKIQFENGWILPKFLLPQNLRFPLLLLDFT